MVDYKQIAAALRNEIRAGTYDASGSFPSLTRIMERFGVSRPSAARSVAELKRLGLVETRKGSGTFVVKINRMIGVAIPGTADSEFFAAVMEELVSECKKHGMELVAGEGFAVDHDVRDRQAERLAHHFAEIGVAGVIMQPVGFSKEANRLNGIITRILDDAGIPVVLIDYDIVPPPGRSRYDLVAIDNFNAGRKLAAHLVSAGAKRIMCLLRSLCADSVHTRFAGVDAGLMRATGRHADILVAEPDDRESVAEGLKKYRPDAIVCSNDIAAGTLAKTLAKIGMRVPEYVMLAGFDDVKLAREMGPGLTTVRQPCSQLASTAFRALLERIKNRKHPPREILLDATLVVRESTRRT